MQRCIIPIAVRNFAILSVSLCWSSGRVRRSLQKQILSCRLAGRIWGNRQQPLRLQGQVKKETSQFERVKHPVSGSSCHELPKLPMTGGPVYHWRQPRFSKAPGGCQEGLGPRLSQWGGRVN